MCPVARDLRLRLRGQSCLDLDTSPFSVSLPKKDTLAWPQ